MSTSPERDAPDLLRDATYHRASAALRERVTAGVAQVAREERAPRLRRSLLLAGAFAAVAAVSWNLALFTSRAETDAVQREVLSAHLRALQAPGRLVDVASSDQHQVKPWFAGKLDYAPPVRDFGSDGFTLLGGRLDVISGRPVAALAYRHRLHAVSVFVWPEAGARDTPPRVDQLQGYAMASWTRGGMRFWAACDASPPELARFAQLLAAG
jgi:anti-sigma factor RsiW